MCIRDSKSPTQEILKASSVDHFDKFYVAKPIQFLPCQWRRHVAGKPVSFIKLETVDLCHKGLCKLGGHEITSCEVLKRCFCWRRHTFYNIYEKRLAHLIMKILKRLIEAGVNGVNRFATNGEKYYWLPTKRENNYRLGQEKYKPTTDIDRSTFQKEHRLCSAFRFFKFAEGVVVCIRGEI